MYGVYLYSYYYLLKWRNTIWISKILKAAMPPTTPMDTMRKNSQFMNLLPWRPITSPITTIFLPILKSQKPKNKRRYSKYSKLLQVSS